MLKGSLLLGLGKFWRSSYRLNTPVAILNVLTVPPHQDILCWIIQLANGCLEPPAKRTSRSLKSPTFCSAVHCETVTTTFPLARPVST
jgi:hypothetical protein